MMGSANARYPLQDKFLREAILHGGGAEWSPGAKAVGFTDANDPAQVEMFVRRLLPDGTPMLRDQKNANKNHLMCRIYSLHPSFNALAKGLDQEGLAKYAEAVKVAALHVEKLYVDGFCKARREGGGKAKEKAETISHVAVHLCNYSGDLNAHVHVHYVGAGLLRKPDHRGRRGLYSLADKRELYQRDERAQMLFQIKVADLTETHLGWKSELRPKERTRPPHREGLWMPISAPDPPQVMVALGAGPALVAMSGDRRREALRYLEKHNVPATPNSMSIAVLATRFAGKFFDLVERIAHWNAQHRLALEMDRTPQGELPRERRGPTAPLKEVPPEALRVIVNGEHLKEKRARREEDEGRDGQRAREGPPKGPRGERGSVPVPDLGVAPEWRGPTPNAYAHMFKAFLQSYLAGPVAVVKAAYRKSRGLDEGPFEVRDLGAFLEATRKRTLQEGHEAALKALKRVNFHLNFSLALEIAERANKEGRRPVLRLAKGAEVSLSPEAAKSATPEQVDALERFCARRKCKLALPEELIWKREREKMAGMGLC